MNYLFLNWNNGHFKTYHPFSCDLLLTQEKVTELLLTIPGARRTGTCVEHLIDILINKGHEADYWTCDHCGSKIKKIESPILSNWTVLEGISGNY